MSDPYTLPLDFDPRPVLNNTAPTHRKRELTGKCMAIVTAFAGTIDDVSVLATLTGSDLEHIAGRRFAARLGELRPFLARMCGREFVPMRSGRAAINNPIPSAPIEGSNDYRYWIEGWAIATVLRIANELSRRRDV